MLANGGGVGALDGHGVLGRRGEHGVVVLEQLAADELVLVVVPVTASSTPALAGELARRNLALPVLAERALPDSATRLSSSTAGTQHTRKRKTMADKPPPPPKGAAAATGAQPSKRRDALIAMEQSVQAQWEREATFSADAVEDGRPKFFVTFPRGARVRDARTALRRE